MKKHKFKYVDYNCLRTSQTLTVGETCTILRIILNICNCMVTMTDNSWNVINFKNWPELYYSELKLV